MVKRFVMFTMCCLIAISSTFARFPERQDTDSYIVLLKEPSVACDTLDEQGRSLYKGIAARRNRNAGLVGRRRAKLEERLSRFEDRLKRFSPRIVPRRRFTGLINGLSLEMPKGYISRIRSLPEVLSIVPNRRYHATLTSSNDLMNTPLAWQLIGGQEVAGEGIKIGIVDTGIDHTHVMFEDGQFEMPEGYPLGDPDFTNKKIIVARVFTKEGDESEGPTPRDRNGHGTHVASCAAGNNTISPLGPISGLAPRAQLGNYKVFTGEFTTLEQIIAALEACVEDGMDVVNLSLGSESYIDTILDPEALAIRNAIKAGVVVVAAAGNSGRPETIGSPGQIPEVITVGSLTNAHDGESSGDLDMAMMNAYVNGKQIIKDEKIVLGPDPDFFSHPLLGRFQIVDADVLDGDDLNGIVCQSLPPGSAQDKWVLVQRGVCTFTNKIDYVQEAGGWGALIYNNEGAEEGLNEPVRSPSVGGTKIPSYFISRNVGLIIKDALNGDNVVEVEFYADDPIERSLQPFEFSSFSSIGPSLGYGIKPEITAIGEGCYGATQNDIPGRFEFDFFTYTSFDLSGFSFSTGTSFSAPRVAGVAALLRQANPSWSPEDIKSAIVISAERPPSLEALSSMERGGGHVNTVGAIDIPVIVKPSTLSLENVLIDEETEVERNLRIKNVSQQYQQVSLSLELFADGQIQTVEISPVQADLAPSESTDISLKMKILPPGRLGDFEDISGDLIIEITGRPELLRIPVWARVMNAPVVQGDVLLIDDDGGKTIEHRYVESVNLAGREATLWDVAKLKAYPSLEYMQKFRVVSWFLATTSLFNIRDNNTLSFNERIRFNVALTRYLTRGGRLLVSGMDWSDQQEETLFGQQVLHISEFVHDPFVQYTFEGDIGSQETTLDISAVVGNPVGRNLPDLNAGFDSDIANMSDILVLDNSGIAKPALITNKDPNNVIGITVETDSYRVVFFSFALERVIRNPRISRSGMDIIIQNSLDWLMEGSKKLLTIRSVEPEAQIDNNIPINVTLMVEGINFLVGYNVRLNDTPAEITNIDMSGTIEILVPAGIPEGLYDITLESPDGQSDIMYGAFAIDDLIQP